MTLFLLLSCGSGSSKTEDPQNKFLKSVISLSNDFLNVFTSLSDMVGGVLGFNTNTKKSDVGNYFKKIQETVQGTKDKLEKIVSDMKSENNPNASAVETAVNNLVTTTLDKIIQGAKTASEAIGDAGDSIGDVADQNAAAATVGGTVKSLSEGIGKIVDVVLKGKGSADAGTAKKAEGGLAGDRGAAQNGEAGKLFDAANADTAENAKKSAADAAKAVGAVTGADILQAIIKDDGDAAAAKLANAKDGTIAGAIALRAMAQGGKFAGPNDNNNADYATAVKGAAISAVTKALNTLTISIRKTVDSGLKAVKDAMNINPNDTPVTTDNTISETKKN
ncbi:variable large family protein (plasmid) [Borrelia turicatae]|nr:variable large family protein [Borrelia turicatae]UPA15803.1 variable large family protein [Borrelia turicatae]